MNHKKKQCTICKDEKPVSMFYRKKSAKDGKTPECISCRKLVWPSYDKRKKEREFLNQFL